MKHTLDPLTGKAPMPAKDQLPNSCHLPLVIFPDDMGYIWSCCSAKDWCWHLGKTTKEGRRERVGVSRGRRESETEREQGREGEGEGEGEKKPGTRNLWKAAPYSQNLSVTHLHPPLCNVSYTTQKDLQDVTPRADAFECSQQLYS